MKTIMQCIKEALEELDDFEGAPTDAAPVMLEENNCSFELVYQNEEGEYVRLTVGDLRQLAKEAEVEL